MAHRTGKTKPLVIDYRKTQIREDEPPPCGVYSIKIVEQLASGAFIFQIQDGPYKGRTFVEYAADYPIEVQTVN